MTMTSVVRVTLMIFLVLVVVAIIMSFMSNGETVPLSYMSFDPGHEVHG